MGAQHGDAARITSTLHPHDLLRDLSLPEAHRDQRDAIADAAARLNELREGWLNPVDAAGAPALNAKDLRQRTLTNLYNQRPTWLANAHDTLDAAVSAAYGWPVNLDDTAILERLLALNLQRSGPKMIPETAKLEATFTNLVTEWERKTGLESRTAVKIEHPAYQRIIGLGEAALPLIFRQMEKKAGHWFRALNAITGADPVSKEIWGNMGKMTEVWLQWGRDQGYRW